MKDPAYTGQFAKKARALIKILHAENMGTGRKHADGDLVEVWRENDNSSWQDAVGRGYLPEWAGRHFEFVHETPVPDSAQRKNTPIHSGVLMYFPDAIAAIARHSKFGNDKHNPGQPLHWSKGKSNDHADCVARHLLDIGKIDPETGYSHTVALAWRALALLQTELENNK